MIGCAGGLAATVRSMIGCAGGLAATVDLAARERSMIGGAGGATGAVTGGNVVQTGTEKRGPRVFPNAVNGTA
jgi:hypothetical protein